ncbi:DNA topoisomerase (ATP-hydrolyzing) subunit A [Buchnera aphidicola (Mollitrichosiphum nigrofasciatum)]|uniref:DNA topoisomerase (ATP-hydrolyzing) subunit A n=1 Tax=Buchnera aphidicola TaxID=9 RepID=UPI0031B8704F
MKEIAKEIKNISIEEELKNSYLDYAMSVIVGRALPDVQDGLKPVHRRILYAMKILGNNSEKSYKKSARIVGDVIGKYHPHGDSAVYEAIVRMAQTFSLRYTLIEGQGNFGSIDGDSAAAMRYTEIRMSKISNELMKDLEKNTVKFIPNYDNTEKIPEILPSRIPNLLINGASGIAVGMATNIPPHNLKEIINGFLKYIENKNISLKKLMKYIPGPDFPTFGIINGTEGIKKAYKTGRGKILIRARSKIEHNLHKKKSIIIYELPYQVNKSKLIKKIAELIKEKKIEGINNLRDESDKDGMRIVIEIKKNNIPEIILNKLYLMTQLQISFGINMVALYKGRPKILSLKKILKAFYRHRIKIVTNRTIFELKQANKKLHILKGLIIALTNINKIIYIIQKIPNFAEAKKKLTKKKWLIKNQIFIFTKKQAKSILNLKLHKLTHLETTNIKKKEKLLKIKIKKFKKILNNKQKMIKVIKNELIKIRNKFKDKRRTKIKNANPNIKIEDIIAQENVVVTLSNSGYVKYQPITDYEAQKRGGTGKSAAKIKEKDFIESLLITKTHDLILCFSTIGIVYWIKVYQLPESSRHAKGKPIVNLLPLSKNERITAILPINKFCNKINVFMATAQGIVKKTPLKEFSKPRNKGIIAINLNKNDKLIGVSLTNGKNNIMLFTAKGKAVHFSENSVRKMGRTASGIRGIKINTNDRVVSLVIPKKIGNILTVTEKGYGKQSQMKEFPIKSRSNKGIISIKITKKNGILIGALEVTQKDQIMIITNAGTLVRIRVSEIAILKRNTQGVILIRTKKQAKVAALQKINSKYFKKLY